VGAALEEKVFLQSDNLLISNTRMNLGGTTYATANISSVSTYVTKPSRKLEVILGIIGLITISQSVLFGIILLALAVGIFMLKKPTYIVKLSSNSNEKDALWSKDQAFINSVVEAINNAIIYRG
jgi:Family of unknown function (DUF6232)